MCRYVAKNASVVVKPCFQEYDIVEINIYLKYIFVENFPIVSPSEIYVMKKALD